jgi:hypothetical protein
MNGPKHHFPAGQWLSITIAGVSIVPVVVVVGVAVGVGVGVGVTSVTVM